MFLRAALGLLVCSIQALAVNVPLAFEQSGASYVAHGQSGRVSIDAAGWISGGVSVDWAGARKTAKLSAEGDAGTENLFIGADPLHWRTGVPLYRSVRVASLYRGIDVRYYGTDRNLEYDLVVAPRADPRQIRMRGKFTIDAHGDLHLGAIVQRRPVAYQIVNSMRRSVESRFALAKDGSARIELGAYDRRLPLTIDPTVVLSSYAGGSDADELHAATIDASGNLYVAGLTYSTPQSNSHVMLLKITPAGAVTSSIFGGTSGNDSANAVKTDSAGNVYLAGYTSSLDFPVLGNTFSCNGTQDAFLLSLTASNSAVNFATCFGGTGNDSALALALAPNNLVYVAGETNSLDFPAASASFQSSNHGGYDGFFAVFSTAGSFTSATYLGGSSDEHAYGLAVDNSGYAYIVGSTVSTDFIAKNPPPAFQTANAGSSDAFALKLSGDATAGQYFTYIGGSGADVANAAALDSSGNLYVAGTTASQNFPVSSLPYESTYAGGQSDGFVFMLAPGGLQGVYSTYFGGAGDDAINGIALDGNANVYLTGTTNGSAFPVTSDATQSKLAGSQDAVIAKLSPDLKTVTYSSYHGGSANDVGNGIALDGTGNVFVAGTTASSDFPVTAGAHQTAYGGGNSDGFYSVTQFSTTPAVNANGIVNGASFVAPVSPGSIISIFGLNFAASAAQATKIPLPTTLGGVTAAVNGVDIPLFYVNETQINAQLPYETATGTASLIVTAPNGTAATTTFTVVSAAPGIFIAGNQAVVQNQDGTVNSSSNGAKPGSVVVIYFTGQGPLDNAVVTGFAAPGSPLSQATSSESVTIGGQATTPSFIGLTPGLVGLAQANVTVPSLSAGSYPVILTIDGAASAAANVVVAAQ